MKTTLKKLILEMVPVILGILIALLINNWQEDRKDRKFIDSVMSAITLELKENKMELESKIEEHQQLLDTIRVYMEDEDVIIGEIINKVNGVRVVSIKNVAWNSFLNPKIELVEYKVVSLLTDISAGKDIMEKQTDQLISIIYGSMGSSAYEDKLSFDTAIRDIISTEQDLLEEHIEFLGLAKE